MTLATLGASGSGGDSAHASGSGSELADYELRGARAVGRARDRGFVGRPGDGPLGGFSAGPRGPARGGDGGADQPDAGGVTGVPGWRGHPDGGGYAAGAADRDVDKRRLEYRG